MRLILAALLAALSGCQAIPVPQLNQASPPTAGTSFTYSTFTGGLWSIDLTGRKTNLLADDRIQKWHLSWSPDRRTLVYVTREFRTGGVEETLFALTPPARTPQRLLGPATKVNYTWTANPRVLQVWSSERRLGTPTPAAGEPDVGKWFQVDVQTARADEIPEPDTPEPSLLSSPDGRWVLKMQPHEDTKAVAVYLIGQSGPAVTKVYEQRASIPFLSAHWSPDSSSIAYVLKEDALSPDLYIFRVRERTSTPVTYRVKKGDYGMVAYLQWSPNSEWLLFSLDNKVAASQLCLVRSSEDHARCFDVHWKANQFVWSTDSRYVAFLAPLTDARLHDIYVLEAATGKVESLTKDADAQIEDWITAP